MLYNVKILPWDKEYDYMEYNYITLHTRYWKWFAYNSMRYDGCPMKYITILGITIAWGEYFEYIEKDFGVEE